MKKHLLIFGFAVLLLAGLNLRNNTAPTFVNFPTGEQALLSRHDDSRNAGIIRDANSLFAPPAPLRTVADGENNNQLNLRFHSTETTANTPQLQAWTLSEPVSDVPALTIACNGAFRRPADYYVYTLRHIVI